MINVIVAFAVPARTDKCTTPVVSVNHHLATDMERPGDVQHVNSADHVHIIEECFPDEDPSANLTAWQVIAKDVLQPLMPLLPEESVPFIQENPIAVLLGAASVLMLIAAGALFLQPL